MISLLFLLLAFGGLCGFLRNRRTVKRLKATRRKAEAFAAWAQAHPYHALTQSVEAELLTIEQNLRMNSEQKVWARVTLTENAYALMQEVQQRQLEHSR